VRTHPCGHVHECIQQFAMARNLEAFHGGTIGCAGGLRVHGAQCERAQKTAFTCRVIEVSISL